MPGSTPPFPLRTPGLGEPDRAQKGLGLGRGSRAALCANKAKTLKDHSLAASTRLLCPYFFSRPSSGPPLAALVQDGLMSPLGGIPSFPDLPAWFHSFLALSFPSRAWSIDSPLGGHS